VEQYQSLGIEHPSAEPFGDHHSQVHEQPYACYPHARICLVLAGKEGIGAMMVVVTEEAVATAVVVVAVMVVSVTRVDPSLL